MCTTAQAASRKAGSCRVGKEVEDRCCSKSTAHRFEGRRCALCLSMRSAPAEGFQAVRGRVLHSSSTSLTKSMHLSRSHTYTITLCYTPKLIPGSFRAVGPFDLKVIQQHSCVLHDVQLQETHLRSATQPLLPVPRSAFDGQSGSPRHRGLKELAYGSCMRSSLRQHACTSRAAQLSQLVNPLRVG